MHPEIIINPIQDLNQVQQVFDIFEQIKATSSKNEKADIIAFNQDKSLFMQVLKFVYDDFITTGLSNKKINKLVTTSLMAIYNLKTLEECMDYLKKHNTGSDTDIFAVQGYLTQLENKALQQFVKDVLTKGLKVGITAKTINKALGRQFIKEFNVQLAFPYNKYPQKLDGNVEFEITQKLDGNRCLAIYDDGQINFYTRKGLPIRGLDRLVFEMGEIAHDYFEFQNNFVLDGELILRDDSLDTETKFRKTTALLKKDNADKSNIEFQVFDWVLLDHFLRGQSENGFSFRKDVLNSMFKQVEGLDYIKLVPTLYKGNDVSKIAQLQRDYVDKYGWEGLMINLADGKYVTKRTNNLLKVKTFYSADVKCIDVFEGEGRLKGTLGGIIIDYKGYKVRVGSGFTDGDRSTLWDNPNSVINQLVEVSYFEEIHNQDNDDISLRFPVFQGVRWDKNEVSYEI